MEAGGRRSVRAVVAGAHANTEGIFCVVETFGRLGPRLAKLVNEIAKLRAAKGKLPTSYYRRLLADNIAGALAVGNAAALHYSGVPLPRRH